MTDDESLDDETPVKQLLASFSSVAQDYIDSGDFSKQIVHPLINAIKRSAQDEQVKKEINSLTEQYSNKLLWVAGGVGMLFAMMSVIIIMLALVLVRGARTSKPSSREVQLS